MPKRERRGDESRPGRVVAPMKVKGLILERGIEFFFEHRLQAVNLIEEQYLAIAQIGENGGEVALDDEGRTRALLKTDVEFVGDDCGQRGFSQAGRTEEEHMVQSFAAGLGRLKSNGELLFGF